MGEPGDECQTVAVGQRGAERTVCVCKPEEGQTEGGKACNSAEMTTFNAFLVVFLAIISV